MRTKRSKLRIITLMIILIIFSLAFPQGNTTAEPELKIESNLRYLFGDGGGEITITIRGELAQEVRKDIFDEYGLNESSTIINDAVVKNYIEAMEDVLERTIRPERRIIDKSPEDAGVEYNGIYKIVEISRVDIKSVEGLMGTTSNDNSEITIKMDIKGDPVSDEKIILSDGYIILYGLISNVSILNLEVEEEATITTVGMTSYSDLKLDAGGEITHYRLVMGEYIEYKSTYNLNGYNLTDNKKDTVQFDSFNIVENSLVIAILILVLTIIAIVIANSFVKKNMIKKVMILRILAIIFFIILAVIYFLGISGTIVWTMTILFFVINLVLAFGIYNKGWGNLAQATFRHEDFVKEPPTIEEGPWHERGIANAKVGNFKEAVNCLENALEAEPENAIIWNDLGFVLRKLRRFQQAIDCFNKALELRSDYPTAQENLEKAQRELEAQKGKKK